MKHNKIFRYLSCMGIFLMMSCMISVSGNANEQILVEKAKHPLSEISSFVKRPIPEQWNGKEQKVIYLTFDDGVTKLTDSILSILDQYNVPATFFLYWDKGESIFRRSEISSWGGVLHWPALDVS